MIFLSSPLLVVSNDAGYFEWVVCAMQIGRDTGLMEGLGGTIAIALTFCCLFCRMEQEVRKVAIWRVFISRWLPEWLNVSWRWSCRRLRERAGPDAWGLVPGCSSSPLKEGQQSNESHSPPNLQLVPCQLYCIFLQFSMFSWNLIHSLCPCVSIFTRDLKHPRHQSLLIPIIFHIFPRCDQKGLLTSVKLYVSSSELVVWQTHNGMDSNQN